MLCPKIEVQSQPMCSSELQDIEYRKYAYCVRSVSMSILREKASTKVCSSDVLEIDKSKTFVHVLQKAHLPVRGSRAYTMSLTPVGRSKKRNVLFANLLCEVVDIFALRKSSLAGDVEEE